MPLPDVATLSLCSTLASTAFGAVFLVLWRGSREQAHLLAFAGSSLLYAATLLLFASADSLGRPVWLVAILHGALIGTDLLLLIGVRLFDRQPGVRPWMGLLVLGTVLVILASGVLMEPGDTADRVFSVIATLMLAIGMAVTGSLLIWGSWRSPSRARRMAGLSLLGYLPGYGLAIASVLTSWPPNPVFALLPLLSDQVLLGVLNLSLVAIAGERAQALLRDRALRDSLTGALNRAGLEAHLDGESPKAGTMVLLIDIDHFKLINDVHGHAAGDAVLVALVSHATGLLPGSRDRICRWGGDEFVVLLHGTTPDRAGLYAGGLHRAVRESQAFGLPRWTISIGFGMVAESDDRLAWAIARADKALYLAKASGRDQIAA